MRDRQETEIAAEDAEAALNIYGLSTECFVVATLDDALRASRRPNKEVRYSDAARIRAAGLDVLPTGRAPHGTLLVPKPLDEAGWSLVQSLFDGPIVNPYNRKRS